MLKKIVLLIFFSVIAYCGFAQREAFTAEAIDRKLMIEYKNREDTEKVNLLKELSLAYAKDGKIEQGLMAGQECLALAQKLSWKKGIAAGNYTLATNYMYKSNYPKALKYSLDQLKQDDAGNKKDLYVGYRNVAIIYSEMRKFQTALTNYFIAMKMAQAMGDKSEIAKMAGSISICYEDMGDYNMAKQYLAEALHVSKSVYGAFDNSLSEYPSPPAYDFKVLKVKAELENLTTVVETSSDDHGGYKDPGDSAKAREKLLMAAIANEYEQKAAKAQTASEREKLKYEQKMREQQIAWEFSRKTHEDSMLHEFKEQNLKLDYEKRTKVSEEEKIRLEEDKRRQAEINAANLKTSRLYSYAAVTVACLLAVIALISVFAYRQNHRDNLTIKKLVNEQEHIIEQRTKELAQSNERLAQANKKLVELVQYNAHRMREPLTRVMGAMAMLEYTTPDEFCKEITPEIKRAVSDLDNSIMQVITLADESIEQYSK